MKKIIPISVLLFVALGIFSWLFIDPQLKIPQAQAMTELHNALDASIAEDVYYWKEVSNWMAVYNQINTLKGSSKEKNKEKTAALLAKRGDKADYDAKTVGKLFDGFGFRLANVYGERTNAKPYSVITDGGLIQNYAVYIREERSDNERIGNASVIKDEEANRLLYRKVIAASYKDNRDNPTIFERINGTTGAPLPLSATPYTDLQDYYNKELKATYGLENLLAELYELYRLENESNGSFMNFNIKEAECTSNGTITNITFALKPEYFESYTGYSIFDGADYISIELLKGRVSQIMCYVRDPNPLPLLAAPTEPYKLDITYLGPKINKPNRTDRDWFNNVIDQY
ncbi:MAG: hypothetical protein LBT20_05555 [Clostridiales bacterium]|jgi:hypothetical protein|nr:hypothetical protein [Clostridiales bacterium]